MTHLTLLTVRSLRSRPSRTMLTAFGIVLGVAVILAIHITNRTTLESISAVFTQASGRAHLIAVAASAGEQGFPQETLGRIRNVPGVQAAVPSLQGQAMIGEDMPEGQGGLGLSFFGPLAGGLLVYGIDPEIDHLAREYQVKEGEFLSPDIDAREILLVQAYANEQRIRVGNDIKLVTPNGAETLRVVGLIGQEGPGRLNNGAFAAIPLHTAQELFARPMDMDQIDIIAAPQVATPAGLDALKAALSARLGDDLTVTHPATQGNRVTTMLTTYQFGLNIVSMIALFVGAFLIYNAFSMTVVERTHEIGMLRTVGMTRRQVILQILTEASLLGFLGSGLGIVAGVFLARGLIRATELVLSLDVHRVTVPLAGVLQSTAVGIGVTIAAALIPALQAGRISPLEALRIRGNPREDWIVRRGWRLGLLILAASFVVLYGVRLPSSLRWLGHAFIFLQLLGGTLVVPLTVTGWQRIATPHMRRIYGGEGHLGSRNIERAKLRTTLTVAALLVGIAMILSVWAITNTFAGDIGAWVQDYMGGDLYVHSSVPMRIDLLPRIAAIDGVAAVTPTRYFQVQWLAEGSEKRTLNWTAVSPLTHQQVASFVFASGQGPPEVMVSRLAAGGAVFASSVLAEKYGLKAGDVMRIETRRGPRDFEIAGIVVDFNQRGMAITGSWEDMRRYFGLNDASVFLVKVAPGEAPDSVQQRIAALYGERRHLSMESNSSLKNRVLGLVDRSSAMFNVLALIAMTVASLGVINTLTTNVMERTREIGMLRSVGMTRLQVRKMILAESAMLGLIGGAFGLVFGVLMSRTALRTINTMMGYELSYRIPLGAVVVSGVLAVVVSQLAALWPARRAASLRIIEAIHFE